MKRTGAAALRAVRARRPGRPPGPSQAADVRARAAAEASRLYAAGGYAGLSFGTLAVRVGITKATVFHYFATKEALVDAVFDRLGTALAARAHGWFDAPPASFAARLERTLAGLVDFYGTDPVNAQIVLHGLLEVERIADRPAAAGDARTVFATFVRDFVAFIEAGIRAGEFHADRAPGTIVSIGGVVLFECMLPGAARRRYGGGGVTLDDRAREVIDFVCRAVVRPRGRTR